MTGSGDGHKTSIGEEGTGAETAPRGRPILYAVGLTLVAVAFLVAAAGDGAFVLATIALQPLNAFALYCVAARLSLLCDPPVGVWPATKAAALSGTLAFVLPGRLAEFVKPVYLSERYGVTPSRALAVLAVERFLDIVVVAVALGIASLLVAHPALLASLAFWGVLAMLGVAGVAALLLWPDLFHTLVRHLPFARLRSAVDAFLTGVRGSMSGGRLVLAVLLGIGAWSSSFVLVHLAINWVGSIPLGWTGTFLVFLAGVAGIAIAVAPGGLGTFETAVVLALTFQGYGAGEALWLAVLIRVANAGFVPLIALWVVFTEGTGFGWLIDRARSYLADRS